jgi:hypothetical protein
MFILHLTLQPNATNRFQQSGWCIGSNPDLYSGRYSLRIPARTPAILTEVFRGFRQSVQIDCGIFIIIIIELSPSWEAANCAATQEPPSILWNLKVHHCVHKSPPLVSILSQIDAILTIQPCIFKIYFNIVHLPTFFVFLVVSFLLAFPPISYMHSSSPPLVLHALSISSSLTWSF